jgi:hypothetical protein
MFSESEHLNRRARYTADAIDHITGIPAYVTVARVAITAERAFRAL